MDKKEAAAKMMNQEQKEAIRELQEAVERYNRNSSDKTYDEVLFAFFMAAKNAKAAFCPVESFESNGFMPGKAATTGGMSYVLCTSPEEAALCPEEVVVVIGMDVIVARAAEDSSCNGLCLNPYGGHPCFFPRDYIRRILGMNQG